IKKKLEGQRQSDEVISGNKPQTPRILEMSGDRNRIVWTEDKKLIFRDLANPLVKTRDMGEFPESFSVSTEAEYALVSLKLSNGTGCRLKAISLVESKNQYDSGAYVSCKNKGSISSEGSVIYYFIDDNLYQEETKEPKKPKLIVPKEKLLAPFPKLKNRYLLFPTGKTFIIFAGNAGSYFLYWFNPKSDSVEKIASDILSPKLFYADGKTAYLFGGSVGSVFLRELKYSSFGKPVISKGFVISQPELNPWKTTKKSEFISGSGDSVYKWGPATKKQIFPMICERFWGVARDHIVYENKKGDLVLSNTEFTPDEWKILDLYKQMKKKK
ncbi:MAG: hypothetical protein K8R21_06295, partial [Leptospira sp.]|nr:hypothetical protein [Leptospira sp.]